MPRQLLNSARRRRHEVNVEDCRLHGNPTWLLPIRSRVAIEELRRELFKGGHRFFGLREAAAADVAPGPRPSVGRPTWIPLVSGQVFAPVADAGVVVPPYGIPRAIALLSFAYYELRHSRKHQVVSANQLRQLILIVEHLLIDPLIAEPRHPFLDLLLNDSRRSVGTE